MIRTFWVIREALFLFLSISLLQTFEFGNNFFFNRQSTVLDAQKTRTLDFTKTRTTRELSRKGTDPPRKLSRKHGSPSIFCENTDPPLKSSNFQCSHTSQCSHTFKRSHSFPCSHYCQCTHTLHVLILPILGCMRTYGV